jgi:hypothetical protein
MPFARSSIANGAPIVLNNWLNLWFHAGMTAPALRQTVS